MSDPCAIDGCDKTAKVRGWCPAHYQRWRKHGDPLGNAPSRTRSMASNGYIRVKSPGHPEADRYGWAYEHRVVAHDHLGPIPAGWHVHHVNHDKADNRPENLEAVSPEAHSREHVTYDHAEVGALYEAGKTTLEIEAMLGVHASQVSRILKARGIKARRSPRTPVDDAELRKLYAETELRVPAMARRLGVGPGVVSRRMRELGLAPRPAGRPPQAAAA